MDAKIKLVLDGVQTTVAGLKGVGDTIGGVTTKLSALTAVGGALSVGAFAMMVKSAADAGEKLKDLAAQTGATVESLSAMKGVAKLSETSLDSVGSAMNKLSKNMASASEDGKGAAAAVKALGLNFEQFKRLAPNEQMLAVAKSMDQFADGGGKSAAAMALFGKEGARMIPFLKDLATVGELNGKITAEQAEMADNFNDNLVRIKASGEAWKKEVGFGILPVMSDLSNAWLETMNGAGGLRQQITDMARDGTLERWARNATIGLTYVIDAGQGVAQVMRVIGTTIGGAMAANVTAFGALLGAVDKLTSGDVRGAWQEVKNGALGVKTIAVETATDIGNILDTELLGAKIRKGLDAAQKARQTATSEIKKQLQFTDTTGEAAAQSEYDKLIKTIQEKIKVQDQALLSDTELTEGEKLRAKVLSDIEQGTLQVTEKQRDYIEALLEGLIAEEKGLVIKKAMLKAAEDMTAASEKEFKSAKEQLDKQRQQNAEIGRSKDQIADLTARKIELEAAADRELAANMRAAAQYAGPLHDAYLQYADDLEKAAKAKEELATEKRAGAQAEVIFDEQRRIWESIDRTAHDTFVNIFNGGRDAFTRLRDTLKSTLLDMLYQMTVRKWVINIGTSVFGSGIADAAQAASGSSTGSALSNASSLMNAGSLANRAGSFFVSNYSTPASSMGLLVDGTTHFSDAGFAASQSAGGFGGSYIPVVGGALTAYGAAKKYGPVGGFAAGAGSVAAGGAIAGALGGTGAMAGATGALAALGPWGWAALAVMAILGGQGGETRYGGGYNIDALTGKAKLAGGPDGGTIGNGQVEQMIETAYAGVAETLKQVGSKAVIQQFTAGLETSDNGVGGTFAGGIINGKLFGQRDQEKVYNQNLSAEDAVKQLSTNLKQAAIEALQAASDIPASLAEALKGVDAKKLSDDQAAQLLNQINAVANFQHALQSLPFENLKNISFDAANGLIAAAGGFDQLIGGLGNYWTKFHTIEEQTAESTRQVTQALSSLGYDHLPATRAEFAAWVDDAMKLKDAASQARLVGLLGLVDALDQLLPPLQNVGDAAAQAAAEVAAKADAAKSALDSAYSVLERSITAEKSRIDAVYEAERKAIEARAEAQEAAAQLQLDAATGTLQTLQSLYNSLQSAAKAAVPMSRRAADQLLQSALGFAGRGGSLSQFSGIEDALQVVGRANPKDYATLEEYERAQAQTAATVESLRGMAGSQLTVGEMTVNGLKDTIKAVQDTAKVQLAALDANHQADLARLDAILNAAQAQIDAINNGSSAQVQAVLTVADAVNQFNSALTGAKAAVGTPSSAPAAADPFAALNAYGAQYGGDAYFQMPGRRLLDDKLHAMEGLASRIGDTADQEFVRVTGHSKQYWEEVQHQLDAGLHPTSSSIVDKWLPGFDVGTNFVPTDMPAMIHRGERIVPAADNRELMARLSTPGSGGAVANSELLAELRANRAVMTALLKVCSDSEDNTKLTKDMLRGVVEGQLKFSTVAA